MLPRHPTDPEVNGPPAEQPVVDRLLVERSAEARDRRKLHLGLRVLTPSLVARSLVIHGWSYLDLPQEVVVVDPAGPPRPKSRPPPYSHRENQAEAMGPSRPALSPTGRRRTSTRPPEQRAGPGHDWRPRGQDEAMREWS